MTDELTAIVDDLHERGYTSITRTEGYEEASGRVSLPDECLRDRPDGWRRLLPQVYCDAGDPDLVPADLCAVVEAHGWTVQAMGRDAATVTVVLSEDGV